jgi:hypothetical protein
MGLLAIGYTQGWWLVGYTGKHGLSEAIDTPYLLITWRIYGLIAVSLWPIYRVSSQLLAISILTAAVGLKIDIGYNVTSAQ